MTNIVRPTFFYRLFQILAYVGAIPFVINTLDIVLNPTASPLDGTVAFRLLTGLLIAPLTIIIGFLCVRRVPDNLIGWMLIAFGHGTSLQAMRVDLLPITAALIIANLSITIFWYSYLLIPFYYPNGRLYPPQMNRWGNVALSLLFALLFIMVNLSNPTLSWGSGARALSVANPFFLTEFDYELITVPIMIGILILGAMSLSLRYREGRPVERLQLRWLLFGVFAQFGLLFLSTGLADLLNVSAEVVSALYTVIIPIAVGVAILRHRLYDIDIIIRRTLIYSVLTAVLAAIYFGGVILTQQMFKAATGQGSDLAIVVSTLLIAALFAPLRRRIQQVIDRRFFRRKYDAEQTLARFNQSLREDVDLSTLERHMITAVQETMQPASLALWVREEPSQ